MNKINEYKKLIITKSFKKNDISKFITLLLINNIEKCTEFAVNKSIYEVINYLSNNTTIVNNIEESFIFNETSKEIKKTMKYLNLNYGLLDVNFGFDIFGDNYKMMHNIFDGILTLNMHSEKKMNLDNRDIIYYFFNYNNKCNEKIEYLKNKTFNMSNNILISKIYTFKKLTLQNDKYHSVEDVLAIATKELAKIYNEESIINFLNWTADKYCNLINNKIEYPKLYTFKEIRDIRNKINNIEFNSSDFDKAILKLTEAFNSIKGEGFIYGERDLIHKNDYFIRKYVMTISKNEEYINYLNRNVIYIKSLLIDDDRELKLELEKLKKEKDQMKNLDILELMNYLNKIINK